MKQLQQKINETFTNAFGRTPLQERLDDILREAMELHRFTDVNSLKEETGDLLASTIQLITECGWDIDHLVQQNLKKIEDRMEQYHSLGRKLKIGLIGGAFDPPTIGHIKLAQFVLNATREFDEVWLTPCYKHMHNKQMTDPEHRVTMCNLAANIDPRIKVFDYEITHKLSGETYNFIKRLQEDERYKDKFNFSVIIGIDNANNFDRWVNYELLERLVRFVVVSRQGYQNDPTSMWYRKPPHIYLDAETEIPEVSSTEARYIIEGYCEQYGDNMTVIKRLIDRNVYQYIKNNNLYGVREEMVL